MSRLVRLMVFVPALLATAVAALAQQPARFEDVVRNLRNPDQKIRISAVRLLRETGYAEAIVPLAAVVNDQVNAIQLEAIDAELSFFLVEPLSTKKHVALVVEVRTEGRAPAAFELGPACGVAQASARRARRRAAAGGRRRQQERSGRGDLHARRDWIGRSAEAVRGRRGQAAEGPRPLRCRRPGRRRARRRSPPGQVGRRRPAQGRERFERRRALRLDPRARRDPRRARDSGADRAAQLLRQGRRRLVGARRARAHRALVEPADVRSAARPTRTHTCAAPPSRASRAPGAPRRSSASSTTSIRTRRRWCAPP